MKIIDKYYFLFFVSMFLLLQVSCKDDNVKYEMTHDLFRPKLVQDPVVELNTILLVWHDIYDAKDYTVEISLKKDFKETFRTYESYENTVLLISDIPYATKYFVRLRANSPVKDIHNSLWMDEIEVSTPKRIVNRVLSLNKEDDLGKDWVVLRWTTDYSVNPLDSISLTPSVEGIESYGKKLSIEDLSNGYLLVKGLTPNVSYTANVYNTLEKSEYNQTYNPIRFRTAGDPVDPIVIPAGTDLTAWFYEKNNDSSIPDGVVYLLEAGSEYILNNKDNASAWDDNWDGVTPNKGFTLIGDSQMGLGRPKVYIRHWFSLSGDASIMAFENIDFYGMNTATGEITADNYNYLINFDSDLSLEMLSIYNCTFTGVGRGLIRTKNDNNKVITNIEIIDSRFYDMCQGGYNVITFNSPSSDLNDQISNILIEGCTFANTNGRQLIGGDAVVSLEELTVTNCTFYKVAVGTAFVNIPSSSGSVNFENNLFAGGTLTDGATIRGYNPGLISSNLNYTTTKENTAATPIGAVLLVGEESVFDEDSLFRNKEIYDFTIIDFDSPVFENYVGDPYWY